MKKVLMFKSANPAFNKIAVAFNGQDTKWFDDTKAAFAFVKSETGRALSDDYAKQILAGKNVSLQIACK